MGKRRKGGMMFGIHRQTERLYPDIQSTAERYNHLVIKAELGSNLSRALN